MAKRNLLLVDADPRSLRVLEVSLRKAGYSITTCAEVDQAVELLELSEPDLIIADTRLPGKDGFALVAEMRARPAIAHIPLIFLSSDPSMESKVRGLELGIEDYLTKPVYIREILARVSMVMERKEREGLGRAAKTRFQGSLEDMGMVDLLQTIDVSRKSGTLKLSSGPRRGLVTFVDGRVVDAELGTLQGAAAVYRALLWNEGSFELEFGDTRADDKLGMPTQALLMEGVRRLDEWGRLQEQLPGLHAVLEVVHTELVQRLGEIPDELNIVLRAFDGQRDLAEVLEVAEGDDLVTLTAISKLFFDGFLRVRHRTDPSVDAQVGAQSDPFIGLVPLESQPPANRQRAGKSLPPLSAVTSVPAQFGGIEAEPNPLDEVPTDSKVPRAVHHEPIVTTGRVPLAVVQLKRVPAITPGLETPAVESEEAMKQRGKRRAAREERGNVIPLHAGLHDDERADRSSEQLRSSDHPGELHHDDDHDVRDFFANAPKSIAPSGEPWLDFDEGEHDHDAPHHHPAHRRGMYWTLGILGVGLVLIGAFLLYNKVLMPTPEEFAVRGPIKLPTPDMLPQPAAAEPVAEAPAVEAPSAEAASAEEVAAAQAVVAPEPSAATAPAAQVVTQVAAASAPTTPVVQADVAAATDASDYPTLVANARKLGFRKAAEDAYLKAIALNPGGFEALSGLAMLYLNQGKNAQALARADQSVSLNPADDEGWIVLGAAQSALGKERLAREAYTHCAALPSGKYVAECKRLLH